MGYGNGKGKSGEWYGQSYGGGKGLAQAVSRLVGKMDWNEWKSEQDAWQKKETEKEERLTKLMTEQNDKFTKALTDHTAAMRGQTQNEDKQVDKKAETESAEVKSLKAEIEEIRAFREEMQRQRLGSAAQRSASPSMSQGFASPRSFDYLDQNMWDAPAGRMMVPQFSPQLQFQAHVPPQMGGFHSPGMAAGPAEQVSIGGARYVRADTVDATAAGLSFGAHSPGLSFGGMGRADSIAGGGGGGIGAGRGSGAGMAAGVHSHGLSFGGQDRGHAGGVMGGGSHTGGSAYETLRKQQNRIMEHEEALRQAYEENERIRVAHQAQLEEQQRRYAMKQEGDFLVHGGQRFIAVDSDYEMDEEDAVTGAATADAGGSPFVTPQAARQHATKAEAPSTAAAPAPPKRTRMCQKRMPPVHMQNPAIRGVELPAAEKVPGTAQTTRGQDRKIAQLNKFGRPCAEKIAELVPELGLTQADIVTLADMTIEAAADAISKAPGPLKWSQAHRRVTAKDNAVGWGRKRMAEEMCIHLWKTGANAGGASSSASGAAGSAELPSVSSWLGGR